MTTWIDALDDFEHRLVTFRAVLEHDVEPIAEGWPPSGLGDQKLPPELVPRARELLNQASELESLMKIRQDALRLRANLGPRHRPFTGRPSRYTDL